MNLATFQATLRDNPNAALHLMLPGGEFVPAHFHVTEVGRVQKDFIDCGGTVRSSAACVLQVWVANDAGHRLTTSKLAAILALAGPVLKSTDLPVEVEYDAGTVAQFPVAGVEVTPSGLLFHLGSKRTDCLAPDRCGVGSTGCC